MLVRKLERPKESAGEENSEEGELDQVVNAGPVEIEHPQDQSGVHAEGCALCDHQRKYHEGKQVAGHKTQNRRKR